MCAELGKFVEFVFAQFTLIPLPCSSSRLSSRSALALFRRSTMTSTSRVHDLSSSKTLLLNSSRNMPFQPLDHRSCALSIHSALSSGRQSLCSFSEEEGIEPEALGLLVSSIPSHFSREIGADHSISSSDLVAITSTIFSQRYHARRINLDRIGQTRCPFSRSQTSSTEPLHQPPRLANKRRRWNHRRTRRWLDLRFISRRFRPIIFISHCHRADPGCPAYNRARTGRYRQEWQGQSERNGRWRREESE